MQTLNSAFTGRDAVALLEEDVPAVGPGEVLVRTSKTLISTGTETIVLSRLFEPASHWADDIAGQRGLLMSLKVWQQALKPHHQRLNKAIHEFGVKVIYHSDGSLIDAVPGLIDMGIDVLQALQFSADGMDPSTLKDAYGDRLCFEGGVSVQTTLPFGTPDDVRQETEMLIRVLGKDGGYILGPSHAIQAGTPPGNILAMFDTALSSGL